MKLKIKVGDRVKVHGSVNGLGGMEGTVVRESDNPSYDWVVKFGANSVATCSFKSEELVKV